MKRALCPLNSGNIIHDAFPFLWPFEYHYSSQTARLIAKHAMQMLDKHILICDMLKTYNWQAGKDTIRVRKPVEMVSVQSTANSSILSAESVKALTKLSPILPPRKPFFSTRLEISNKCKDWCIDNGVKESPFNIITAAFKLGLVKR